ncbi:MAG TPA: MATE family efflux transporter [Planctomycetota bacterium]|nr:MATE family efflux transporter [Planctomycetota bacterium]
MAHNSLARLVWRASLPILFVEATETLDHLIDSLFLAHVGEMELGAIAVADSVLLMFLIAPLVLADGIQIITARRVGQRRPGAVGAVFDQGLLFVLLASVAMTVALKVVSPLATAWLVESEAVAEAVDSYLQLDAYSICLVGATFAFSALLTSIGRTRVLVPATAILVIVDVVLNYLFIFGKFGCPEMGMRGAAIGSIGAEAAVAVFLGVYAWRHLRPGAYRLLRFGRFVPRTTRLLGRIAAPLAAKCLLLDLRWFVFFLIVERMGTSALAAANIVFTCYIVFLIPAEGFSEIACSMVSRYVGRNRTDRIGRMLRSATGGAILATVPFLLLALLAPHWLTALFSPGSELLAESQTSMRVIALTMLVAIPAHMWLTAVEGTGDTAAALGIECVLTLTMLGLTWCAAIELAWPLAVVWCALPLSLLVSLTISYCWMRSGAWRRLEL